MTTTKTDSTAKWADQYKHPKWQKKRLEVLEHDGFTCQNCGDKESQLHVHHGAYVKGRKMWEYDIDDLVTLCDDCHKKVHKCKDVLSAVITPKLTNNFRIEGGFTYIDMYNLLVEILYDKEVSLAEYLEARNEV